MTTEVHLRGVDDAESPSGSLSRADRRAMNAEAERDRCARLAKIGEKYRALGGVELAQRAIGESWSVERLCDEIAYREDSRPRQRPLSDLPQLSPREARDFSVLRAVRYLLDPRKVGNCLEVEVSQDLERQSSRAARGLMLPIAALSKRTLSVGSDSAGGFLVPETLAMGDFAASLRAASVVMQAGARDLAGLQGDVAIPRATAGSAVGWVDEAGNAPETNVAFGQVRVTPHTMAAYTDLTRKLLLQTGGAAEAIVREDLAAAMGAELDRVALNGSGLSGEPAGVLAAVGLNEQAISSDASPTYAEIVGFESEIETDNALADGMAYVVHPAIKKALKTTPRFTNSDTPIWNGERVNGYRAFATSNLPSNGILFGNFRELYIGSWGVIDISVDTAALALSGGHRVIAFFDVDTAVRRPQAFCKGT